jgi:hypothetical protein
MAKEIVLRLNETEANALWQLLYSHGELIAAGAPVMPPLPGHELDLLRVYEEITHQLGHMTMAEAMQASIDRKAQEQSER